MLAEKKTFGQEPFCSSASTSVPGAPASSLATDSQPAVLNPGAEICWPGWVAVALVRTFQPPEPRSDNAVDPVGGAAVAVSTLAGAPLPAAWDGAANTEGAPEPAARIAVAANARPVPRVRFM